MSWRPREIDTQPITTQEVLAELSREMNMRVKVYTARIDSGQMSADRAVAQFGPLFRAYKDYNAIAKADTSVETLLKLRERLDARGGLHRVKLALDVLDAAEKNPQAFAAALGGEAAKMLMEAFPDAKIVINDSDDLVDAA
jgi:hypothetical protein